MKSERGLTNKVGVSVALLRTHLSEASDVYLNFSGGKESVVLAHMCAQWRDKVSLVWVNTGYQAPHMVDFIRGYGGRFRINELAQGNDLMAVWAKAGRPTELMDLRQGVNVSNPKWMPWVECCNLIRNGPLALFYEELSGRPLVISGVRLDDDGPHKSDPVHWGTHYQQHATMDIMYPLRDWSETDVLTFIEAEGLALPMQYAEGVKDSLECVVCPVKMTKARLAHLERHYPDAATIVRDTVSDMIVDAAEVVEGMADAIGTA